VSGGWLTASSGVFDNTAMRAAASAVTYELGAEVYAYKVASPPVGFHGGGATRTAAPSRDHTSELTTALDSSAIICALVRFRDENGGAGSDFEAAAGLLSMRNGPTPALLVPQPKSNLVCLYRSTIGREKRVKHPHS